MRRKWKKCWNIIRGGKAMAEKENLLRKEPEEHISSENISSIKERAKQLVSQMTLEEKAGLCSGRDTWYLKSVERLGLESIMMADGPHGLRKQVEEGDNLGIGNSLPAVCFPTASALACSFDKELVYEVGKVLGEECKKEQVSVLLGPGVNQKRSPLCGRNFEYFSEDPVLSGELAASMIEGIQSQSIGTSLKHFTANNQEKRRMTIDAVVDERALRETYLKAFEIAVKKGKPWTVMCAYNRLNGTYCSENADLLTGILREEWGFEGLVVSDWGAVSNRVLGIKAGEDLEMPGGVEVNDKRIIKAVQSGQLSMEALDTVVIRIIQLILKAMKSKTDNKDSYIVKHCNMEDHHNLAIRAAEESAVLLKNEEGILPGNIAQKALVIGPMAKTPRYQGAGSSKIHPVKVDSPLTMLINSGLNLEYVDGYYKNDNLIREACEVAKGKDIIYIFAGLPDGYESEGFDRNSLKLPESQNRLIETIADSNPNVAVILAGGSPMELPWEKKVKGILLTYLAGEGCGSAIANLLLGKAVPCGKLAETWPLRIEDVPSYHYFPDGNTSVEYRESIYVGYKYYERAEKPVLYPFGHGLSYTAFTYSNINVEKENYEYGEPIVVTFDVENTGAVEGKEIALLFISHKNEKVFMPVKELKAFEAVKLQPGEKRTLSITLEPSDFTYYNTLIHDWYAESGMYTIWIGTSSSDCRLQKNIYINNIAQPQPDLREDAPVYYNFGKGELRVSDKAFAALYGKPLVPIDKVFTRPYDDNNTLMDVNHTFTGKLIRKAADHIANSKTTGGLEDRAMMTAMIREMPFHSMVTSGGGIITENMMEGILDLLNGHYVSGVGKLLKK
jgi:beta-glucosidase